MSQSLFSLFSFEPEEELSDLTVYALLKFIRALLPLLQVSVKVCFLLIMMTVKSFLNSIYQLVRHFLVPPKNSKVRVWVPSRLLPDSRKVTKITELAENSVQNSDSALLSEEGTHPLS